jgi:ATPase family associated with various cellular activities (AAA)
MLSFEELTEARRSLQDFCMLHVPGLMSQRFGISFRLFPDESNPRRKRQRVRHLTSTATCWSSLLDCPPTFFPNDYNKEDVKRTAVQFARSALARTDWRSEWSAGIYGRCRALPFVIKQWDSEPEYFRSPIRRRPAKEIVTNHIKIILAQLAQPGRFGIGEADPQSLRQEWYPPNAFHTYWTLEVLDLMRSRYKTLSKRTALDLNGRRAGMLHWSRQQLGYQIGLHSATPQSSMLDSDQLAWSLVTFLRFDESFHADLEKQDFIKQALKCLFSTQNAGTWRHYKPLFHYKKAGNAYCYAFETFAVLLQCAFKGSPQAEIARDLFKPYCKNLMDLWHYADSTKIPLPAYGEKVFGWCSGHRTNDASPESWATASVFDYAQALRRLIGIWCREEALYSLKAARSQVSPRKAEHEMASRGKTWSTKKTSVSEQLWTMFINPVRMHVCDDRLEPDSQPIAEDHARSAILFGPPGTSKTTLVRRLADVIGWTYVELHASDFVAEGLTQVQKTADRIFNQLLEVDHAVVLFDEIDELVRERDIEKDAFGRFLTTSMLPKLAELWAARKILYFVATNHINYFDSAIIRSHRFDALMFVSPPSFQAKVKHITELLSDVHGIPRVSFQIEAKQIQRKLERVQPNLSILRGGTPARNETEEVLVARWREQKLDEDDLGLAKFVLLRYDELDELACRLASLLKAQSPVLKKISIDILGEALQQVADSEWRKNKNYADYLRDMGSERRDYKMLNVWKLIGNAKLTGKTKKKTIPGVLEANNFSWLAKAVQSPTEIDIPGFQLRFRPLGCVQIRPSRSK